MRLRFLWITNVPTPYRNHSFETMADVFPRHGVDFEVWFMSWRDQRRDWRFDESALRYPFRRWKGIEPTIGGTPLYTNPGLIWQLKHRPPHAFLMGGWASPSQALAPFLVGPSSIKILGTEGDAYAELRRGATSRWVKKRILRRYDAYLVPQQRTREYLMNIESSVADKPWVCFPNIVDGRKFRDGVTSARRRRSGIRAELGISDGQQLWICAARLATEKGLSALIRLLKHTPNVVLLVAGEGPERAAIQQMIGAQRVSARLLGNQPEGRMVELYASADVFVLPSERDPSPVSAVEACAAGLPLWLSEHAGNVNDVLTPGHNGWLYRPGHNSYNVDCARRIAAASHDELVSMGMRSLSLYLERFDTQTCVKRLVDFIVYLVDRGENSTMLLDEGATQRPALGGGRL